MVYRYLAAGMFGASVTSLIIAARPEQSITFALIGVGCAILAHLKWEA